MGKSNETARAVFDFFILLSVILTVALLLNAFVTLVWGNSGEESKRIEYTLCIRELRNSQTELIGVGDPLIESAGKRHIGTVSAIEVRKSTVEVFDGKALITEGVVGYSDLYLTVSAMAKIEKTDITVDGYNLKIGRTVYLYLPMLSAVGECVEIREVGA